MVKVYDEIGR